MRSQTALFIALCAAAVAVFTTPGQSNQGGFAGTTVAVVDMTVIFEKSQMVKDLERIFAQERSKIQTDAEDKRSKLKTLQQELESGAFAKGSQDYQQRLERFEWSKMELEHFLRTKDRWLLQQHKSWFERIFKQVSLACREIAQSEGIDVILADNPLEFEVPDSAALVSQILQKKVIYASPRVDRTPQVLERVDQAYLRSGGAAQIKLAK